MLLLAHTGITLGIFYLLHRTFSKLSFSRKKEKKFASPAQKPSRLSLSPSPDPALPAPSKNWQIDYRLILLGSIFPDIIDKPLGMLLFANLIANGRTYSHTIAINLILILIGLYLLKRKKPNFLIFGLSSCFHLVLDKMGQTPQTLFWPYYGWQFPKVEIISWWEYIFQGIFTNPWVYVPEIIGAIILNGFGILLIKKKMVGKFLLKGASP